MKQKVLLLRTKITQVTESIKTIIAIGRTDVSGSFIDVKMCAIQLKLLYQIKIYTL